MPHPHRLALLALLALLTGCGPSDPPPPAPASPPAPSVPERDLLEQTVRALVTAQNAGDRPLFAQRMRALAPTRAELARLLRPGAASERFLADAADLTVEGGAGGKEVGPDQPLPPTNRTQVVVHAATTEELAAYVKGTPAFAEFPGGMRRFAEQVAAPGRTWYAVELLAPGEAQGTRLSVFTRLDGKWLLVAKPWRHVAREEEPAQPK